MNNRYYGKTPKECGSQFEIDTIAYFRNSSKFSDYIFIDSEHVENQNIINKYNIPISPQGTTKDIGVDIYGIQNDEIKILIQCKFRSGGIIGLSDLRTYFNSFNQFYDATIGYVIISHTTKISENTVNEINKHYSKVSVFNYNNFEMFDNEYNEEISERKIEKIPPLLNTTNDIENLDQNNEIEIVELEDIENLDQNENEIEKQNEISKLSILDILKYVESFKLGDVEFKKDSRNKIICSDLSIPISRIKIEDSEFQPHSSNISKNSKTQSLQPSISQALPKIHKFRKVQDEIYNLIISNPNKNYKIMAACGTGKTITFKRVINKIQNNFEHIIILVPSIILAEQTIYKTFEVEQNEELPIIKVNAYYSGNSLNNNSNITVCVNNSIVKTLYHVCRSLKIDVSEYLISSDDKQSEEQALRHPKDDEDRLFNEYYSKLKSHKLLFIIDEAHHVFVENFKNDSDSLNISENSTYYDKIRQIVLNTNSETPPLLKAIESESNNFTYYAFTATFKSKPDYKYPLSKAINDKILVPYELDIINVNEDTLEERFSKLIQILKNDKYKRILIYVNKIRLAQLLSFYLCLISADCKSKNDYPHNIDKVKFDKLKNESINEFNILTPITIGHEIPNKDFEIHSNAEYIVDSDSRKKRDEIFEKLRKGEIRIIISVNCIAEGVDLPFVDTVIMLNDRESEIQTIQIIGRALRTYKADEENDEIEDSEIEIENLDSFDDSDDEVVLGVLNLKTYSSNISKNSKQIGYVVLFSTPNYSSTKLQNTLSILLKYDNELYKRKIESIKIENVPDFDSSENGNLKIKETRELLNLDNIIIENENNIKHLTHRYSFNDMIIILQTHYIINNHIPRNSDIVNVRIGERIVNIPVRLLNHIFNMFVNEYPNVIMNIYHLNENQLNLIKNYYFIDIPENERRNIITLHGRYLIHHSNSQNSQNPHLNSQTLSLKACTSQNRNQIIINRHLINVNDLNYPLTIRTNNINPNSRNKYCQDYLNQYLQEPIRREYEEYIIVRNNRNQNRGTICLNIDNNEYLLINVNDLFR